MEFFQYVTFFNMRPDEMEIWKEKRPQAQEILHLGLVTWFF